MAMDPAVVMDALPVASNSWFDIEGFPVRVADLLGGSVAATPNFDYEAVQVPTLSIGGFFDVFARGTIMQFDAVRANAARKPTAEHRLIMGPWLHAGVPLPTRAG